MYIRVCIYILHIRFLYVEIFDLRCSSFFKISFPPKSFLGVLNIFKTVETELVFLVGLKPPCWGAKATPLEVLVTLRPWACWTHTPKMYLVLGPSAPRISVLMCQSL